MSFDLAIARDRRVLVTGAAGFIGTHLVRRLVEAGAEVHGTSRQVRPVAEPNLRWHQIDLTDGVAVDEMLSRVEPEVVVHLASHVAGSRELAAVLPTFHANLASTVYLLTAAQKVGCRRFVQAGSLEEGEDGRPPAVPASPYAAAKAAASSYLRMFHELYGTPVVHARIFMVYGPAQQDLRKLIPYVVLARLRGEHVQLSSGTRPVDWVYVEDVVDGLLRLAFAERSGSDGEVLAGAGLEGQSVDLGTGELHTVREVVEKLFDLITPGEKPEFGGLVDRPMEQVRAARAAATEELLGWRPTTGLDAGLAATIEYYRRLKP